MGTEIHVAVTIFALRKKTLVTAANTVASGDHRGWAELPKLKLADNNPQEQLEHLLNLLGIQLEHVYSNGWVYEKLTQALTLNWWAITEEQPINQPYFWTPTKVGSWTNPDNVCKSTALIQLQKLVNTQTVPQALPDTVTLTQLQTLYETIWDTKLDGPNFRKKIFASGSLTELETQTQQNRGRPAKLYSWKETTFPNVLYKNMNETLAAEQPTTCI